MAKSSSPDPELLARLDRIEQKLDALLALVRGGGRSGGPFGGAFGGAGGDDRFAPTETVLAHVRSGQLIHAIKEYREYTGLGLKEAKDAIDRFREQMAGGSAPPTAPDVTRNYDDDYR